jgi:hypothetical protein
MYTYLVSLSLCVCSVVAHLLFDSMTMDRLDPSSVAHSRPECKDQKPVLTGRDR